MPEWLAELYPWIKALHIISVIAWMAGMLYLPRLFVYHSTVAPESEAAAMLKMMERRLLRIIINPAMIAALLFGGTMLALPGAIDWSAWWVYVKLVLVAAMMAVHGQFALWRRNFEAGTNIRPAKTYRIANEVPTLLMIVIVILAVVKPG
ncbi:MAG: protoporphyrinogen oxidase HemJ [Gammaproteobacteria bacterium]|nr:protoporphyrinogen oxidase HemJ [Gammaproteobacteria bacterium]